MSEGCALGGAEPFHVDQASLMAYEFVFCIRPWNTGNKYGHLTITADSDVLKKARIRALEQNTSVAKT